MSDNKIPPPPEKPSPNECCGSGCVPCIYDYYFDAFDKWDQQYGQNLAEKTAAKGLQEHDKIRN